MYLCQIFQTTMASKKIIVEGTEIRLMAADENDYICLTDITKNFGGDGAMIESWMRNRNTVEFLGVWERLHNPNFNSVGFDGIARQAGLNTFKISAKKWMEETNAIGIYAKAGRYGGTYAHKDIAIQFCYWLSPTFQLFLIKEFERLKAEEANAKNLEWDVKRIMTKASYPIQTDAVRQHLIPPKIQYTKGEGMYFASEADLLNVALFGMSAKQWREKNPKAKGNIRDNATHEQLLILSIMQGLNAKLLEWGSDKEQRLEILNKAAIDWMQLVIEGNALSQLPDIQQKLLSLIHI